MRLKTLEKNGFIFYITCSLLKIENEEVIENFLMDNKHFRLLNKKTLQLMTVEMVFLCCIAKEKLKLILNFFMIAY